jgi:chemotaxis response regulator CheB
MVIKKHPAQKNTPPPKKSKGKQNSAEKTAASATKKSKLARIPDAQPAESFPIVGIGAYAGGLETF